MGQAKDDRLSRTREAPTRGFFSGADETSSGGISRLPMEHAKGSPGRPPHHPTDIDRRVVLLLASQGIPQGRICSVLGISEKTLRFRYRKELDRGAARLEATLALRLFELAAGNGPTALKAIRFVLKSKFGWSEFAPPPRR